MLKALIFDVDGTLADTERDGHRVAFNAAFQELGVPWHWSETRYGELLKVTGGKERMQHFARLHAQDALEWPDFPELVARLHGVKTRRYVRLVRDGALPLRPGVAPLIREARAAGILLAIATTTTPENVSALLAATLGPAAEGWFGVIGAGDVVPAKKPAPDIYRWVLERLGVAPHECLALEDSANGLRAALGAGVPTVVTRNAYTRGEDFSGALTVLDDLSGTTLAALEQLHKESLM